MHVGIPTQGGRENVPGIPGACTIRFFAYPVRGPFHVSSSQDYINWYLARRSDGKVGIIPGIYVKKREEVVNAPQTPFKIVDRMTDVPDQEKAPTTIPTKQGEVELSDMQVRRRGRSYKQN